MIQLDQYEITTEDCYGDALPVIECLRCHQWNVINIQPWSSMNARERRGKVKPEARKSVLAGRWDNVAEALLLIEKHEEEWKHDQ